MPWVLLGTRFAGRYHSLSPRPSPTLGRGTHPLTHTGKRTGGAARSLSWAAYGGGAARGTRCRSHWGGSTTRLLESSYAGTVQWPAYRAPGLLCAQDPCLHIYHLDRPRTLNGFAAAGRSPLALTRHHHRCGGRGELRWRRGAAWGLGWHPVFPACAAEWLVPGVFLRVS